MIKEIDRLKREDEERRKLEEEAKEAEKKKSEAAAAAAAVIESGNEKEKKKNEEQKAPEQAKKPIPRPPPLPTCWPPQVVDGKNVGGDGGASFGMPMGGAGRGGLLSALMGGRGEGRGGPLAFLRRKSGTMFKPPVPKLKQLHWDTLESTEGTLWAEDTCKLGMVTLLTVGVINPRPFPTMLSLISLKSSRQPRKKIQQQKLPKISQELLDCQEVERINRYLVRDEEEVILS